MNQPSSAPSTTLHPDQEALFRRSYDQLQTTLSFGMVATWYWDIGHDEVYGDRNLLRLFGVAETPESVGLPLSTFTNAIHTDDQTRVKQLIEETLQSGHSYEAEYRIVGKDADVRWVLARGQLSYDERNQLRTFSGVLIDVSERKQAEVRSKQTEARLQLVIEAAKVGTWDFNPVSQKLIWSDRCKELFGLPPDSLIDYNVFLQGLHPSDRERTDRVVQQALQPGSDGRYDTEYRTVGLQDGQLRWIRANGQAIFNEAGEAVQFLGTVVDITDNKRTETVLHQRVAEQTENLERQASQLRATLDASLNSIIAMTAVRDEQGAIIDFMMDTANAAVIKSNFMTPDQIIGQRLLVVFPGNQDNGFFDLYKEVIRTGEARQSTQYYEDEFGLEGWFEVSAVKLAEDGLVVTYNNITDRKQAELAVRKQATELNEANAELKRSNESLQQFAHIASHDLQEPLRRIQAFSDLLKSQFADNLAEGERDMIRRIQKSAHRMQMLVKDLLMYSKLSTQREPFTVVALTDVLTDVLSDLEVSISEKKATVHVDPLPDVMGSTSRLRQLFQNLIANALKFIPADRAPVITIHCLPAQPTQLPESLQSQPTQSFWLISLTDNGIGFDERYKDRIFTPFQRLHDAATYGGTGIGLAICQRVVESHGGAIDVSSQPGTGSTFKIFLPLSTHELPLYRS